MKGFCTCILSTFVVILFSGCGVAFEGHTPQLTQFDNQYNSKICDYQIVQQKIAKKDDLILWGILGGSLAFNCADYQKSIEFFDIAEEVYKADVDMQSVGSSVMDSAKSILVNNNVNEYQGNYYERIMVNIYKGVDFMFLNDMQNARVEFNRALDRQRRAKEYFASEIAQQQRQISSDPNLHFAQNEQTLGVINQAYAYDFDFRAYPDFVNPFATYMAGLFFLLDKEYSKSADLFKESLLMDPENSQIKSDLRLANNLANQTSRRGKKSYAWIVYEDGRSLEKDEIKLDIPLFIFTDKIYYTSIALPKLNERNSSFKTLHVDNGSEKIVKTQEVANMDSVMKSEFQKRFGGIMMESLLSTIAKTVMQKQLIDSAGVAGGIIGALYQVTTTKADVRSWRTLPKSYNVTRVEITSKPIKITSPEGIVLFEQTLPKEYNSLIYVKSPQIGSEMIQVLIFNKE